MRVATWNVNGLRARLDYLTHWLAARQPDVVGLQELKTPTDDFPHEYFADLGYHAAVYGQKSWNGVAILSKLPLETRQIGLPGQDDFGSRLITATIDDRLLFSTVYCPNGKTVEHADYQGKLGWYDDLTQHWQAEYELPAILCGDFNIVPEPLDTWRGASGDGGIFHTAAERKAMQRLLDKNLIDLYRNQYPEEQAFTWWDYRGGAFHRKHGLRIDFLLANQLGVQAAKDVIIDRDYRRKIDGLTASDHAPVYADLDL